MSLAELARTITPGELTIVAAQGPLHDLPEVRATEHMHSLICLIVISLTMFEIREHPQAKIPYVS